MSDVATVVVLGIGVVFIGLIFIVLICKIMSALCRERKPVNDDKPSISEQTSKIQNRQEIIAAVSAVIAEELGTDIEALKILSFKKI